MTEITLRNLPGWLVENLSRAASEKGTSLEDEAARQLEEAVLAELERLRESAAAESGTCPDSLTLIREMRD